MNTRCNKVNITSIILGQMKVHAFNLSILEANEDRSLWVKAS